MKNNIFKNGCRQKAETKIFSLNSNAAWFFFAFGWKHFELIKCNRSLNFEFIKCNRSLNLNFYKGIAFKKLKFSVYLQRLCLFFLIVYTNLIFLISRVCVCLLMHNFISLFSISELWVFVLYIHGNLSNKNHNITLYC